MEPTILIPWVSSDTEVEFLVPFIRQIAEKVFETEGRRIPFKVGCVLESPRSFLKAGCIARTGVDIFILATDNLTQLMYGFPKKDTSQFLVIILFYLFISISSFSFVVVQNIYKEKKIMAKDPLASLDENGVGVMVRTAVEQIRHCNPLVKIGVSGNHAENSSSIYFLDSLGIDFITCDPHRYPNSKLSAAQAHIRQTKRNQILSIIKFDLLIVVDEHCFSGIDSNYLSRFWSDRAWNRKVI